MARNFGSIGLISFVVWLGKLFFFFFEMLKRYVASFMSYIYIYTHFCIYYIIKVGFRNSSCVK